MTTTKKQPAKKPTKKAPKAAKGKKAPPPVTGEPVEEVLPLSALDLSIARLVRAGQDEEAVERYAARYKAGDPMPPISVAAVKGDPAVPVFAGDGSHRVEAATRAGKSSVSAMVWYCETRELAERKAWEIACHSNVTHGLPRTSDDLRAALKAALLREPPASSDRHIATLLDCHTTTVMKVRVQMTEAGKLEGKASAEGRYKETEYKKWLTGTGDRPAKPTPKPAGDRAVTQPDPAAWRNLDLGDLDLKPKVEAKLREQGVTNAGGLADAIKAGSGGFGEADLRDLTEIVEELEKDGLIQVDAPAGVPIVPLTTLLEREGEADADATVTDEKGRPVPDHLLGVFASRSKFRSFSQRVGGFVREVEELSQTPAGAAVQVNPLRSDADNLSKGLAGAMPYAVCPKCDGGPDPVCAVCTGRGWLSRMRFDQLTPDLKAKAGGPWGESVEG